MHQLQRIGLWGITILLLLGFWAGLWYQGQRSGESMVVSMEGGEAGEGQGAGSFFKPPAEGKRDESPDPYETGAGRETAGGAENGWGTEKQDWYPEGYSIDDIYWQSELAVHVVGAVASPGLYYLPAGSRIYDAVMEAEPEENANLGLINMAVPLEDGMQIRVLTIGQPSPWGAEALIVRASDNQENVLVGADQSMSGQSPAAAGKININKASAKELEALPGIGAVYSQRIIQYREQNGGFKSIEDLMKVKGIGPAKMSELRDKVTCS